MGEPADLSPNRPPAYDELLSHAQALEATVAGNLQALGPVGPGQVVVLRLTPPDDPSGTAALRGVMASMGALLGAPLFVLTPDTELELRHVAAEAVAELGRLAGVLRRCAAGEDHLSPEGMVELSEALERIATGPA